MANAPLSHSALWPATLAVVLLQHGINLLNDVKDWQLGADTLKFDSWVRIHGERLDITSLHGWLSLLSGGLLGLLTLLAHQRLWILSFTLPLVLLGILYNSGKKPLSYSAAGEWATAICYGPGVFGGLWFTAAQPLNGTLLLGMLAFAAFATALLFSHQPPQIETDRRAGKRSFAVRHGAEATYRASMLLLVISLGALSLAFCLFGEKISAACFSLGFLAACSWIYKLTPNPRRIMVSTALVFLLTALGAVLEY